MKRLERQIYNVSPSTWITLSLIHVSLSGVMYTYTLVPSCNPLLASEAKEGQNKSLCPVIVINGHRFIEDLKSQIEENTRSDSIDIP